MTLKNHNLPTSVDPAIEALRARARARPTYKVVEKREALIDRIHDLMESQGISRAELARRMGVTRGYVTQLLSGDSKNFQFETLEKLADVFEQDLRIEFRPRMRAALRPVARLDATAFGHNEFKHIDTAQFRSEEKATAGVQEIAMPALRLAA